MTKFYNDLDYILKDAKVNSIHKLIALPHYSNNHLKERNYPWVHEIAKLLSNNQDLFINNYNNTDTFIFSAREDVYMNPKNFVHDTTINTVARYACLFPKKAIIDASTITYDDNGESIIESYTLEAYLRFRNLIVNDIANFSPSCTIVNNNRLKLINENVNQIMINSRGFLNADPNMLKNSSLVKNIMIKIPWLENARIEDYIELVKTNKNQFEGYGLVINKLIKSAENLNELPAKVLEELSESSNELSIILQTKQAELKSKGIVALLGLCCTLIPVVLPQVSSLIEPKLLSSLLGVGTIKELISIGTDVTKIKNTGKENPYWIMWKWKQLSDV